MISVYVIYALSLTIFIPVLIGVAGYRLLSKSQRLITWLLVIGLFNEVLMMAVAFMKMSNLFTMHFYALVEIVFLSLYFHSLAKTDSIKKSILIVMAGLCVFSVVYSLFGNNILEFNSLPRAAECIYFSLLCIWMFFEMAVDEDPIDGSHYFITGAIMFYFSACFLVFTFSKYFIQDIDVLRLMFTMHSLVNVFCNLIYAVGLWIASKRYLSEV